MANENVLRSYLASIGYKVDEDSYRKFRDNLADSAKKLKELGAVAVAAATEITASVIKVASNMEQLYFATQRSNATSRNLQALRFGAEQIGVSADHAQALVEGLASAVRSQPGMVALLQSLNLNPREDKVKLLIDLITRLKQFSDRGQHQVATAYASMFGIDEPTLAMLEKNLSELKRQMEANRRINPIDDAKLKKFHELMVEVRKVEEKFRILAGVIADRFAPVLIAALPLISKFLDFLIKLDSETHGVSSVILGLATALYSLYGAAKFLRTLGGWLGLGDAAQGVGFIGVLTGVVTQVLAIAASIYGLTEAIKTFYHQYHMNHKEELERQLARTRLAKKSGMDTSQFEKVTYQQAQEAGIDTNKWKDVLAGTPTANTNVQNLLETYSNKFGVNPALVKALAYQESRFNQNAVSKKGALGVMQLMPDTAKQLGVDPNNLEGNISGGVRLLASLLKKYAGNEMKALAAYNAGEPAVDKYGGVPPFPETMDYVSKIMQYKLGGIPTGGGKAPVTIQQKTEINVNGSGDPKSTADAVLKGQDNVNAQILRNLGGAAAR
jgi:hypothetical protein